MRPTVSASDKDKVHIVSTFAPLVTQPNTGQRRSQIKDCAAAAADPAGKRHWLRREWRDPAALAESNLGDHALLPGLLSDEPRPYHPRDDSERGSWIAIAVLTALGIAFLIFALLNPELIANTFGTN